MVLLLQLLGHRLLLSVLLRSIAFFCATKCGKSSGNGRKGGISIIVDRNNIEITTFGGLERIEGGVHFRLLDAVAAALGEAFVAEVDGHVVDARIRRALAFDHPGNGRRLEFDVRTIRIYSTHTCRWECRARGHA